jgi:hypothetical protein
MLFLTLHSHCICNRHEIDISGKNMGTKLTRTQTNFSEIRSYFLAVQHGMNKDKEKSVT